MSAAELGDLEKEVRKLKRIAAERAGELHDLVEDKLPAGYRELPVVAQAAFDACQAWAVAQAKLNSMQPSS